MDYSGMTPFTILRKICDDIPTALEVTQKTDTTAPICVYVASCLGMETEGIGNVDEARQNACKSMLYILKTTPGLLKGRAARRIQMLDVRTWYVPQDQVEADIAHKEIIWACRKRQLLPPTYEITIEGTKSIRLYSVTGYVSQVDSDCRPQVIMSSTVTGYSKIEATIVCDRELRLGLEQHDLNNRIVRNITAADMNDEYSEHSDMELEEHGSEEEYEEPRRSFLLSIVPDDIPPSNPPPKRSLLQTISTIQRTNGKFLTKVSEPEQLMKALMNEMGIGCRVYEVPNQVEDDDYVVYCDIPDLKVCTVAIKSTLEEAIRFSVIRAIKSVCMLYGSATFYQQAQNEDELFFQE